MHIVFDLDDTMYNVRASFYKTHEELYGNQTDLTAEEVYKIYRKYDKQAFKMWSEGLIDKKDEFFYRISHTYEDIGISLSGKDAEEFNRRYRANQGQILFFDGFEAMLDEIKKKAIPMAVLSNGKYVDQLNKLRALGIIKWIAEENIFISENLPAAKPKVSAFKAVEEKISAKPHEIWYIGDSFENDITGCHASGWHCIWFNHRGNDMPEASEIRADYEVKSLEELRSLLQEIIG